MISKKSRKQIRKELRKQKKSRKNEYYTHKSKGKFVLNPDLPNKAQTGNIQLQKHFQKGNHGSKEKEGTENIKKNNNQTLSSNETMQRTLLKEKKEQKKLQKEMEKHRKDQMKKAILDEDHNIKQLEKQLKLNKRKSKGIPKSFSNDGLDYILEVCEMDGLKEAAIAEQQLLETDDNFEEDFALMSGKPSKSFSKENVSDEENAENFSNDYSSEDEADGFFVRNSSVKKKRKEKKEGKRIIMKKSTKNKDKRYKEEGEGGSEEEEIVGASEEEDDDDEIMDGSEEEEDAIIGLSKEEGREREGEENDDQMTDKSEEEEEEQGEIDSEEESENDKMIEISSTKIDARKQTKRKAETENAKTIKKKKENVSGHFNHMKDNEDEDIGDEDEKDNGVWEDIYGRLRAKDGSIIQNNERKYIPPAVRAKLEAEASGDKNRQEKLNRLKRQLKGLINRLAEANMHKIATEIEQLYMSNSRYDMNETLANLIFDALISHILTPERFILEHVMLIAILHANIGTEIGAHFLQNLVKKFDEIYAKDQPSDNKVLENIVHILSHLYSFKVFDGKLLYEILEKLNVRFSERDVECILLILKSVGFSLRKDDPIALKRLILNIQKQAANASEYTKDNPRVKFMLDILLAIKNNNMTKIPNYDTSYAEHLKKLLKNFVRKGLYVSTLNICLEDLLKADEQGKWWIVGSAWSGKETGSMDEAPQKNQKQLFSQKLLQLARKQRMNTDTRRNIFCILMSAEDYLDAFEKLLHLGLKSQQEREIINVLIHCCLQEKDFNPYYAHLAQKFCDYDRRFQMTIKCSVWDKLKALSECSGRQLSHLAKLLTHLFLENGLPISTLKVMQFSELDKITLRFIRQILLGILLCDDAEQCQQVFTKVAQGEKLKMFRESLRLFIKHFLLRNLKNVSEDQKGLLEERANLVDKLLSMNDRKIRF